jgi:Domain of unknown function (DUF6089)
MKPLTSASSLLAGLALAGSIFLPSEASAQMMPTVARQAKNYNSVSVHLNAMNYFGDLVPKTSFTSFRFGATRPNLGISYMHRFAPRLSGRVGLSYGRITGNDQKSADNGDRDAVYRYNRNLSFRNDIVELSAVGVLDLFENRGTYLKRRDFAPYVFAGVAAYYHNPKAVKDGEVVALQPLGTEGQKSSNRAAQGYEKPYKRGQISIPFGIGANYKLSRQLNLGYEIGWRKTFTDYLDDVSGNYADPRDLGAEVNAQGEITRQSQASTFADRSAEADAAIKSNPQFKGSYGVKGQKRGTNNEDDWYIVSGFHLSYILIPDTKSPKFR